MSSHEGGTDLLEYALLIALIALVAIAAFNAISAGGGVSTLWHRFAASF